MAFVFLLQMKLPVLIKIFARAQTAQPQHGFSSLKSPARAGQFHPIFEQMTAGSFDHSRRNRQSGFEILVVVEVLAILEQVVRATVERRTLLFVQAAECGTAAQPGSNQRTAATQNLEQSLSHPHFGSGVALAIESPGRAPEVFADVDQIQDNRRLDSAVARDQPQNPQLVPASIDQHAPVFCLCRITAQGFVKSLADDGLRRMLDTCPNALVFRARRLGSGRCFSPQLCDDFFRRSDKRLNRIDGGDCAHAFGPCFLAPAAPMREFVLTNFGRFARDFAQICPAHRDPFAIAADDQDRATGTNLFRPLRTLSFIKSVKVLRRTLNQLFDLSFWDTDASAPLNRAHNFVKGSLCGYFCSAPPQSVRVEFWRQIQRPIEWMETLQPAPAITGARDGYWTEDGFELTSVKPLMRMPVAEGVDNRRSCRARSASIKMSLQHQSEQFTTFGFDQSFQFAVAHPLSL